MTGKDNHFEQTRAMRREAQRRAALRPEILKAMTPREVRHLVHELQVHQIELEMQNENLRAAHAELDAVSARYFDLYDLAPVGYVVLSESGLILESNLTVATLLDVPRSSLTKKPISQFILKDDQDIYYLHRKNLFKSRKPQSCELRMLKMDGSTRWISMMAAVSCDTEENTTCRVTLTDISERKQLEKSVKTHMNELELFNKMTIGRELRMIELKKEINTLCRETEKPEAYPLNTISKDPV